MKCILAVFMNVQMACAKHRMRSGPKFWQVREAQAFSRYALYSVQFDLTRQRLSQLSACRAQSASRAHTEFSGWLRKLAINHTCVWA